MKRQVVEDVVKNVKDKLNVITATTPMNGYYALKFGSRKYRLHDDMSVQHGQRILCKSGDIDAVVDAIVAHYRDLESKNIVRSMRNQGDLRPYMLKQLEKLQGADTRIVTNKDGNVEVLHNNDRIDVNMTSDGKIQIALPIYICNSYNVCAGDPQFDPDYDLCNSIKGVISAIDEFRRKVKKALSQ
jgi:hypothetical protein